MEPRKRTLRSTPTLKIPSGTDEESKVHHGRLSRLHRGVRARSQAQRMTVKVLASTFAFLLFSFYVLLELISRSSALVSPTARILHQDLPEIVPSTSGTMEQILLPKRPRIIGYYFENSKTESHIGTERIDPNFVRLYKSHAGSGMTAEEWERQEDLKASEDYRYGRADVLETGDCVAQYEWQKRSFPSCNSVLEQDMTDLGLDANGKDSVRLIANGYWRDVWRIQSESDRAVLKTLRYEHDWEERNYDRHRRDAVAMERLTASPHVIDIYAFCGNSGVFEFADGGSVEDQIWYESDLEDWSAEEKLAIAHQLVSGLADFHNVEKEGVPAMAHADITPSQFVYVKETGTYKLNDFNRCRFIPINNKTNELCPYFVGNNPGTVGVVVSDRTL